jgi:hypothetical protein
MMSLSQGGAFCSVTRRYEPAIETSVYVGVVESVYGKGPEFTYRITSTNLERVWFQVRAVSQAYRVGIGDTTADSLMSEVFD